MAFDRNDPAHRLALWTEITTDPNAYGYSQANVDTGVITPINALRAGITFQRPSVSGAAIRAACTFAAYDTLSIDKQEWIRWMCSGSDLDVMDVMHTTDLRLQLTGSGNATASMWAAAHRTAMVAAMLAILDRDGSRAEQLWGADTYILPADWYAARDNHG